MVYLSYPLLNLHSSSLIKSSSYSLGPTPFCKVDSYKLVKKPLVPTEVINKPLHIGKIRKTEDHLRKKQPMKMDEEIIHSSHPQHMLKLRYTEIPFTCDGCKEAGIGLKYECEHCQFELHKVCAIARPVITQPFYKKCEFRFYQRPPGTEMRFCDACGNDVLGFVYHCDRCGFDLHPCCANLPRVLHDGDHNLYLSLKLSSSCHHCGGKGPGWSYRSECRNYNLHVSCVKELLVESWQAMYLNVDNNKVRELQTRIPSLEGNNLERHHRGKGGKMKKCCQIAAGAVSVIVSAILGDPTAIIAAAVGALISR